MSIELNRRVGALERLVNRLTVSRPAPVAAGAASSVALSMPGVIGVWLGAVDRDGGAAVNAIVDATGTQSPMVKVNNAFVGIDSTRPYLHYMDFGGNNDEFSVGSSSNNRITGAETIMLSPGLSWAAWVRFDNTASAVEPYISIWRESTNARGYRMYRDASGYITFAVSSDGTAVTTAAHTTVTGANEWVFTAGRFTPSTELAVWRNLEKVTNTSSIPASLYASMAGDFRFGNQDNPSPLCINGKMGFPLWLSIAAVPDSEIERFYTATAPMFLGA